MSIGYAELLAPRADVGGQLGAPELHEPAASILRKMARLAAIVRDAKAAIETGAPLELPPPPGPPPRAGRGGGGGAGAAAAATAAAAAAVATTTKAPAAAAATTAATTAAAARPPWDPTRPHASPLVAFTGAGLSTSCGIPDFRGPSGVWTLRSRGQPAPPAAVGFSHARPSLAHMALVELHTRGYLSLVVSQNVDGLHLRSGLPRAALAELHGDCFAERCAECGAEYVRDFEMPSVGFKETGRACTQPPRQTARRRQRRKGGGDEGQGGGGAAAAAAATTTAAAAATAAASLPVPACFCATGNPPGTELLGAARPPPPPSFFEDGEDNEADDDEDNANDNKSGLPAPSCCGGPLRDQCLDWDDPLPPRELREAERRASAAAVALCLGTSLQIRPAAELPLKAVRQSGCLAIVNLQATPKDRRAALSCRARCDEAAAALLDALGLEAPDFVRTDRLRVSHGAAWEEEHEEEEEEGKEGGGGGGGGGGRRAKSWAFELRVGSVHGEGLPLPMVRRVEVAFEEGGGGGGGRPAGIEGEVFDLEAPAAGAEKEEEEEGKEAGAGGSAPPTRPPPPPPRMVLRRGRVSASARRVTAVLRLALVEEHADDPGTIRELRYELAAPPPPAAAAAADAAGATKARGSATLAFETQRVAYAARQRALVDDLRRRADEEARAGPAASPAQQQQQQQQDGTKPPTPRRPRAPAAQTQRYGERESEAVVAAACEQDDDDDDDEGEGEREEKGDEDFVPRGGRAASAAAGGGGGGGERASRRPRKAAKLLNI